jgi:TonB family protein
MAQPPDLERRFVAMLNPALNHRAATRGAILAVCLIAIGVGLPLAAMRAPEQAQQPSSAPTTVLVTASAPASKVMASAVKAVRARSAAPKPAAAQGPADLIGTVSDGTGAVVPGVTVTVSSVETRTVETTVTGEVGKFAFRTLPAGQYTLTAELRGFTTFSRGGLEITPGQTLEQKVTLSVGNVVQKVEVSVSGKPRPPLPPPTRIRVGGNVRMATLLSQVKPIYPESAKDAGIEGTVHLQGAIGPDGTLVTLRVASRGDPDLANAALEAVRQWRYSPALLNNEPVEVLTDIDVEFKLAQ